MDSHQHHHRCDSSNQGRENKPQRKKAFGGGGPAPYATSGNEEAEKKPKFPLNIRTLTDDVLDRFASIRIPGSKKERTHLSHMSKQSSCEWSTSSEFEDLSSRITSEKEILALFEKMMEDMNLNEDKKAPLREKDLSTKREMVLQYIVTAAKTGSLRSSSRQISPQEFLSELKSGATDERLFACLDSLRVSLTSNPVSWVQSFGHEGLGLLLDILERLLHKRHQEKVDKRSQHKVIQCLKAFMNNKEQGISCPLLNSGGGSWTRLLDRSGEALMIRPLLFEKPDRSRSPVGLLMCCNLKSLHVSLDHFYPFFPPTPATQQTEMTSCSTHTCIDKALEWD